MPRIEQDPHLEVCPDYASIHYTPFRDLIINTGATQEEAVVQMVGAWQQENEARREAWNQQLEEDQNALVENERLLREQEEQEQELARRKREKKKPKINNFDTNRLVGSFITPRPSTYALNKLESFEYVELFYFTREGCLDAQTNQRTEADDAYGLTRVGEVLSFKSISAIRASKNVIQDVNLTWSQLTYAKTSYLQHVGKAGWPQKHAEALTHFFIALEASPFRSQANGEKILITYQAQVRRHWHDRLKQEGDGGFNIALIDNGLLESISNEIWDIVYADNKKEARSPIMTPVTTKLIVQFFLFFPYDNSFPFPSACYIPNMPTFSITPATVDSWAMLHLTTLSTHLWDFAA
jgi:hypothetical protein